MNKNTRRIKIALIVLLGVCLGAVIWFFANFRQLQKPLQSALPKMAAKSLMALHQVRQTATKDGNVQWQLEAEAAELEAETGRMVLQSPKVEFFLEDGAKVHLSAEQGVLNTKNNNMEVRGNVRLRNDQYTLVTAALAYQHERQVITTPTPVDIRGPSIELHAATMTYDMKTNQTQFDGPVQGVLHEIPVM